MASIEILARDVDDLPDVCMQCGEPARQRIVRHFTWHSSGLLMAVLLLGPLGLAFYMYFGRCLNKRMDVSAPMCGAHQNHWRKRALLKEAPLLILIILGVVSAIVYLQGMFDPGRMPVSLLVLISVGVTVPFFAVISIAIELSTIRPAEISGRAILLKSVSPIFADAYKHMRLLRNAPGTQVDNEQVQSPRDAVCANRQPPRGSRK